METKVYIQSMNKFPLFDWGVDALMGFKMRGANIYLYENIKEVPCNRNVILVASIEDTREFFNCVGYKEPESMTMPKELLLYTGRRIEIMTLEKSLEIDHYPYFIKPYSRLKNFDSGIVENPGMRKLIDPKADLNQLVLVSDVVDFVSEYRGYVINKELVGLKHYKGDLRKFPDTDIIDLAIKNYTSQPAGYSIDFGITSEGRTLLVECNDGWSLGNYGLYCRLYVSLLVARWREIIEQNPII